MASTRSYQNLMEPGYIGSVQSKNWIIKKGTKQVFYDYIDGYVPKESKEYYEALVRDCIGLIFVGSAEFDFQVTQNPKGYSIRDDRYIPNLSELNKVILKHGCPAFLQLFHISPMRSFVLWNYPFTFWDGFTPRAEVRMYV